MIYLIISLLAVIVLLLVFILRFKSKETFVLDDASNKPKIDSYRLNDYSYLNEVKKLLSESVGIIVQDDPSTQLYPMPKYAHNRDEVFVGRIRLDETLPNAINMWIVADNLRKGAATNAVQIAEYLLAKQLV